MGYFLVALCIFVLDQLTKFLVKTHIGPLDSVLITSFLNIVHVVNTGSAFGLFRSLGNPFFIIISLLAVAVVTALIIKDGGSRLPLASILGGAAGNLADRIVFRQVTDFLDFHLGSLHWPAFNVADSALTIGIALLLIKQINSKS